MTPAGMSEPAPMTLDEFFAEAKRLDLRAGDLFPTVIERLAEGGDPEAIAALARLTSRPAVVPEPAITKRELAFALNYHSDDSRINDADWSIADRYFAVIESNRGIHPSLGGPDPWAAPAAVREPAPLYPAVPPSEEKK